MTNEQNKHEALDHYFMESSDLFLTKKDNIKRIIGLCISTPFIVLAIAPGLIGFGGIGFRIIFAVIALVVLAFTFFGGLNKYYNKRTNGLITTLKQKTFHLDGENDMEEIISAYNNEDFEALSEVASTDSGSLKIEIKHDKIGKECWLLLINEYYAKVNYISEIKNFKDAKYEELLPILKKM